MPRDRYEDEDDRPRRRGRDEDDDNEDRPRRRRREDDDDLERAPRSRRRQRSEEDDFDRPAPKSGNGLAIASLILGLLSLCFGPITGGIGIVLGLVGLRKRTGRGLAISGLILSLLFSIVWTLLIVWMYLESQKLRKETNNLKELGLASHNYEMAYGAFPLPYYGRPDFTRNPNSDFSDKLSWRVSILPFLQQDRVFAQFNQDQPWDSTTNRPLADLPIQQYVDADTPTDPSTRLRAFYGNRAFFDTNNRGRTISSVPDGTSNTIMYVEGGDKVTWSRFQEYKYDPNAPLPSLGKANKPTFMVVMADGSVRMLKKNMSETTLRAMITADGGEVVEMDR